MELQEITKSESVFEREMNKALMVAFINRYLPDSAGLDVRKSFVYYDEHKEFVIATNNELKGPGADKAFEKLGIKYWSKGIK